MSDQAPEWIEVEELEEEDTWMPDDEALINEDAVSEDQEPDPDSEVIFPTNGDDSMADDDVEDPDVLDDDSNAVG